MTERFYCVRQRAGNLVKEYRGTMPPRYAPSDTDEDRRAKADLKAQRRTVLNRDSTDRLELMIALMGKYATHYILEVDDEHLPLCRRAQGAAGLPAARGALSRQGRP